MASDPTASSDVDIMANARQLQSAHGAGIIAKAARKIRRAWSR